MGGGGESVPEKKVMLHSTGLFRISFRCGRPRMEYDTTPLPLRYPDLT